jgi:hypothetical protein
MMLNRHRDIRFKGMTSTKDVIPEAPQKELTLEEMDVDQLKQYAADHEIEIGRSSSVDGILKKIQEAEAAADEAADPEDPEGEPEEPAEE